MAHTNRSAAKANAARRKAAAAKQMSLPMAEQLRRRDANAKANAARYPVPPVYPDGRQTGSKTQPACYTFGPDSTIALIAGLMMRRRRRAG